MIIKSNFPILKNEALKNQGLVKDATAGMNVEVDIKPLLGVVFGFMIFSNHISSFSTLEI